MALNTITDIIHSELQKHQVAINSLSTFTTYRLHNQRQVNVWYDNYTNTINIRYYTSHVITTAIFNNNTLNILHTYNPQDPTFDIQQIIQEIVTWLSTPLPKSSTAN